MSKWTDSDNWSRWTCATCGVSMHDPDTVSRTSCSKGHTNYLGVIEGRRLNIRRAYKTAKERANEIRLSNVIAKMLNEVAPISARIVRKP